MMLPSLSGLVLLYVGGVLFINGLGLLQRVDEQALIFINAFVGIITFIVAIYLIFSETSTLIELKNPAFVLLFSGTYLWIAYNHYVNGDNRGLGWYCLFVSLTAIPISINLLQTAHGIWPILLSYCWVSWSVLWFLYFMHLVFKKIPRRYLGYFTIIIGIASAWLPGYLLLNTKMGSPSETG